MEDGGGEQQPHSIRSNLTMDEEALEIKSLRRIISAYLNYPDAAEKDVRRYERSFRKLPPEHKAILSHLPFKNQRMRRCISVNTHFIMNMLQAFEPPVDISKDIDIADDENIVHAVEDHLHVEAASNNDEKIFSSGQHTCLDDCKSVSEIQQLECRETSGLNQTSSKSCDAEQVNLSLLDWLNPSFQLKVPLVDVDKVRFIIRNIVRDWAAEGQRERDQCYKPILEELDRLFPVRCQNRPPTCLVPGAGLGRLALEISSLGFVSQGNEFSYYMMICSSFILNHTHIAGEWEIYPWIHSNCNSISDNDQFRAVSFPDIHPASAGITEGFSMCGGDFVEVYSDVSQEGSWDAVVTCFFLDTAHNVVEYIEIISKILKEGGVWINLGPLLYHFADAYGAENEMSIELSLEDVKNTAFHYGFVMEMEKNIATTYTTNPRSMMQNQYFAAFWTMRKISKKGDVLLNIDCR